MRFRPKSIGATPAGSRSTPATRCSTRNRRPRTPAIRAWAARRITSSGRTAITAMDAFTSRHRFIAYGVVGCAARPRRASTAIKHVPRVADDLVGGWQLSWQAFIKSGTQFTPIWLCDNCEPVVPGNIASGSVDATGGFYGTSFRPVVTGDPNVVERRPNLESRRVRAAAAGRRPVRQSAGGQAQHAVRPGHLRSEHGRPQGVPLRRETRARNWAPTSTTS